MENLCNKLLEINKVFLFIIGLIFSTICLFIFITFFNKPELKTNMSITILLTVVFTSLILLFKWNKIKFRQIKMSKTSIILTLICICFLVKWVWVFNFRIEPVVDYKVFYRLAKNLAENTDIVRARYVAAFPHIFGYSFFLSMIFKVIGSGELVAPITNVVLTCISMIFIFGISYNISGLRAAVISSIFWILLPSQTIYNMFSLSEPLYTTLLLLAWFISTVLLKKCNQLSIYKTAFLGIVSGLALGYANSTRPIAIIVVISFFIYLFILSFSNDDFKRSLKNKAIFLIVTLIVYFSFNNAFNSYIEKTLGQEIASTPGITLLFGFNQDTYGGWNTEDASKFSLRTDQDEIEGKSVNETQKHMIELLKERLLIEDIDYSKLMFNKFSHLWSHDSAALGYAHDTIADGLKSKLIVISNAFYYSIVLIALLTAIKLMNRREFNPLLIFMLFVIGLTFAHSIAEVAPRYHYAAMPSFIIIASFIFKRDTNKTLNTNKKERIEN